MVKKRDCGVRCLHCKGALPAGRRGPCPICGKPVTSATVGLPREAPDKPLPASDMRRDFYENHQSIAVLMIVIVFSLPILGVFTMGMLGLLLGVAASVSAYYLLPYAKLRLHGRRRSGQAE